MAQQGMTVREGLSGYTDGHSEVPSGSEIPSSHLPQTPQPGQASEPDTNELPEVAGETAPVVGRSPEGYVFLVLPPGGVVNTAMAAAAAEEVEQLAGPRSVPVLLVLTGVEAITRGARAVFSGAGSLAAVAVLGKTPVDRVIANFLLGGAVQPCPTRYFEDEQDALVWLKRKNVA